MSKRVTVVFDDEDLYAAVKAEAARKGVRTKDIMSQAIREWLEAREDEELRQGIEEARADWKREGGMLAKEFFRQADA